MKHLRMFIANSILYDAESSACPTQLPSLADERILPAATQQQERDQGKVVVHTYTLHMV